MVASNGTTKGSQTHQGFASQSVRRHFSMSQLSQYLQCPYAYKLRYIDGVPWPHTPSAVTFGSVCHKAIEAFNRYRMDGQRVALADSFAVSWDKVDVEDAEKADLKEKGVALMGMFEEQFGDVVPTAVEKSFRLPLVTPKGEFLGMDVVGVIDCVADETIVEYKTAGRSSNDVEVMENSQLTLYSWAYRMVFGKPEKGIKLVQLVKTKTPKIQVFETVRDDKDYELLFDTITGVSRAIDLGVFYRNVNGFCNSCVYRELCR